MPRQAATDTPHVSVVVLVYNVWQGAQLLSPQEALVDSLVKTGTPVIVIAQGTPYDAAYLPGVAAFLNALDDHDYPLPVGIDAINLAPRAEARKSALWHHARMSLLAALEPRVAAAPAGADSLLLLDPMVCTTG